MRSRRPLIAPVLAGLFSLAAAGAPVACGPSVDQAPVRHAEPPSAGPPLLVSDAEFAGAVHDLLQARPGSPERTRLLGGVLGRQMERATTRFRSHEVGQGVVAVIGGLYLLHTGELTKDSLGPSARSALRDAVHELAVRGDEGRARALYDILLQLGDGDGKVEIQGHLDAIQAWTKDELLAGPPTIATGAVETACVARSLLEPTDAAKADALKATLDWIASAIDLQLKYREKKVRPSREEVGEAVRALHSGNDVLAEIFLRDADAAGAARALARSPSHDALRPELQHALDALGAKGSATASQWIDVLHALTPSAREREQEEDEVMEDHELLRATTFGIALEAYRLDPTITESATFVAALLQDLGFAEASPAIMIDAARTHSDARTVSQAVTIVLRAMSLELSANDVDAVRRTYTAAAPVLAIAEQKDLLHEVQPSAARVRAMMGDIELEQGSVDVARALLSASAAQERSGAVLLALARIDRHDKQLKAALEDLAGARDSPDAARDPALKGEILLLVSDLLRDSGDSAGMRAPLVDALAVLVSARSLGSPEQRARVEQVLARVLDRLGALDLACLGLARGRAAPHDKRQLAATLNQVIARAFVRRDLRAAKEGLARGIAAELGDDDVIYYALWVHLLEKQLARPGERAADTTVSRVFASIPDDGHWVGRLAAFGAGKLPASQLPGLAKTKAEKTEATFYQVMDQRTGPPTDVNDAGLRSIVDGDGVDLMESVIAREMLRVAAGETPPALPPDIKLP
jgi:hypothetical protein